jgi:hypothetical protein
MSHDIVRDAREDREDAERWRNRSETTIPGPNRNQILAALATLDQYPLLKDRVMEFQVEAALRAAMMPSQLVGGDPCPTCGVPLSTLTF